METYVEQYLELLSQKLSLHEEIEIMTLKLYDLIIEENFSELGQLLHQRDTLTYEIIDINLKQKEFEKNWKIPQSTEIKRIQDKIVEIREKIVYHDNILKKKMIDQREEYKNELREINLNRKASRSYNLWDYESNSSFIDKRQ